LQLIQESRSDIRGRKPFFQKTFNQMLLPAMLRPLERFPHFLENQRVASLINILLGRNLATSKTRLGEALDIADLEYFTPCDEGNGKATSPSSARSPNSVNIIFRIVGKIVVEHDLDVIHVDPSSSNVRSN
jgi:hypothetical protein